MLHAFIWGGHVYNKGECMLRAFKRKAVKPPSISIVIPRNEGRTEYRPYTFHRS